MGACGPESHKPKSVQGTDGNSMEREPCDLVKTRQSTRDEASVQLALGALPPSIPRAPSPNSILSWPSPCCPQLTVSTTNCTQARTGKGGRRMGLGGSQGAQGHRGAFLQKV